MSDDYITNRNLNKNNNDNSNESIDGLTLEQIAANERILGLEDKLRDVNLTLDRLDNMQNSLASLQVGEQYKVVYDRMVRPAVDIVALMSSSTYYIVKSAESYNTNIYAQRRNVKKALEISERMLCEVERGLDLFDTEMQCLIKESNMNKCK